MKQIPLFKVLMSESVHDALKPVLYSGYIGEGQKVAEFETALKKYLNNDNVLVVNSGTSALMLALKLAGVGYGDKVITTPMTCLATNMAIVNMGGVPVWADVDKYTGMLIAENIEMQITPDVKAIMVMDMGGSPCRIDEIMEVARKYNIPVIEDACQAFGSEYNGEKIGNQADYVCYSFQAIKYLTTGDGGALVVNNGDIEKGRLFRWFGLDRTKSTSMRSDQDPPVCGYKWHLTDIAATIGIENLKIVDNAIEKARDNAQYYNKFIHEKYVIIPTNKGVKSNYWMYQLSMYNVDEFITYMASKGIECSRVHRRNDTKTIFRDYAKLLPDTEFFDMNTVCIPVGWWVTDGDREYIAKCMLNFG